MRQHYWNCHAAAEGRVLLQAQVTPHAVMSGRALSFAPTSYDVMYVSDSSVGLIDDAFVAWPEAPREGDLQHGPQRLVRATCSMARSAS